MEQRWRRPARMLAILAGWAVFVWAWMRVAAETPAARAVWGVIAVGLITGVAVGVTAWWIHHNLRIYRRKGPRRAVPLAMPDYRTDFLGRRLEAEWTLLRRSNVVVIRTDSDGKRFVPGVESPGWGLHP